MSRITHENYLSRLGMLKGVADLASRTALLALTTVAIALPVAQIAIPALGQGRILHVGGLTGLGSGSAALIAACAILTIAPAAPFLSRFVRPADIVMGVVALALTWLAWSGLNEVQGSVERVAAFGLLLDDSYAPVTSWRWGLPFAVAAVGLAVWRAAVAVSRPLHLSAS